MNICDRRESTRKDICLGYYSSALSERALSSYEKTSIGDVTLVNEETLDLRFNMTNKYKPLTNSLIYTVRLYDEEKKLKASFDLNNTKVDGNQLIKGEETSNNKITTIVTFYDDEENALDKTKELTFRAYADSKYVVHLTLDGLDLAAADAVEKSADTAGTQGTGSQDRTGSTEDIDSTYSISRLNLDTGRKIYVRLQASGANYKPSAWKQSNLESPYFADSSTENTEISVRNARHLFNIRFREVENTVSTYMQKESFAWGGEDGILAAKHVFNNENTVEWSEGNESAFPAIPKLGAGNTYEGYGKKEVSIQELVLGKDKTAPEEDGGSGGTGDTEDTGKTGGTGAAEGTGDARTAGDTGTPGSTVNTGISADMEYTRAVRDIDTTESAGTDGDAEDAEEPGSSLGLFCENNGTIKDIIFENVVVDNAVADNETAGDGDTALPGDGNDGGEGTAGGTDGEAGIGEDDSEETGFEKFGFISATEKYAGGIVGYNTGIVENCRTDVDTSAINGENLLQTAVVWGGSGSYVGGIAGYNNGAIKSDSMLGITVVAAGENYVGGIVGYNDIKAEITDYKVTGGYISGECFMSGYAGLNASEKFFDKERIASPNLIKGGWYVGGIAGANLVPTTKDLKLKCDTDNFLGSVNATGAFTGGFIGINALLPATTTAEELEETGEKLAEAAEADSLKEGTALALKAVNSHNTAGKVMNIVGGSSSESITSGKSELNQITGTVYAAGIVAYNSKKTELNIENITNKTPVIAKESLDDLDNTLGFGTDKTYSFAGGIIGVAEEKVRISKCSNQDAGEVTSTGTHGR